MKLTPFWRNTKPAHERPASVKPAWLYASGCCEHWTPEHGCGDGHTGRPAMSLAARELGCEEQS